MRQGGQACKKTINRGIVEAGDVPPVATNSVDIGDCHAVAYEKGMEGVEEWKGWKGVEGWEGGVEEGTRTYKLAVALSGITI